MMTFKETLSYALLTFCATLALTPTSHAAGTIEPGQLSVGTDLTYPPYNYFDDSKQPAGFDVELMTALAKAANLKIKFSDTRFENLIIGVSSDQFDVIASTLYVKPERAKKIDYIPYMKSGISIAVLKGSNLSFQKLEGLCGQVVGSVKGSAWLERIAEINKAECASSEIDAREFPTAPEVTQALMSGAINAQIEDSAVLAEAARKVKGRIVITTTEQLFPVIIGFGLKKNNTALAKVLNDAMTALRESGHYQTLLEKYNVASPTKEEFRAAVDG